MDNKKPPIIAIILFVALPFLFHIIPRAVEPDEDGIYCSDVTYFNPETGTESNYTLPVEVIDEMVTKIKFPNGGWLDDTHFEPDYVDEGEATIVTDKGYRYTVVLKYHGDCD